MGVMVSSAVHADGWTQPQGKGMMAATGRVYSTSVFYDKDGHKQRVPAYSKFSTQIYGEYGLRDAATLGLSSEGYYVRQATVSGEVRNNGGLAGAELFTRLRLWHDDAAVLSVQPFVKTTSWEWSRELLAPRGAPQEWQAGAMLQGGYGFNAWGLHHYATLGLGWRERFSAAHDQYLVRLGAGIALTPRWTLLPELSLEHPTHLRDDPTMSFSGVNDYALTKLQLKAEYALTPRMKVQAGGFWHVDARNTGNHGGVESSLLWSF